LKKVRILLDITLFSDTLVHVKNYAPTLVGAFSFVAACPEVPKGILFTLSLEGPAFFIFRRLGPAPVLNHSEALLLDTPAYREKVSF